MDFGESRAYGLDSPVFDLGGAIPNVVTQSHQHADHSSGALPEGIDTILTGAHSYTEGRMTITPIPTFEGSLEAPDNMSFLVEYGGLRILHLGDCQALIQDADENAVRDLIQRLYPETYDLVFLPIGFVEDILEEASEFITLLDARRVIPMHYWSPADRDAFLDRMRFRTDRRGREYSVKASTGASLLLTAEGPWGGVPEVLGLTPAPFSAAGSASRR
jgi:hypothetical protein